ncbi:MAG: HAMP domain-containing histidine kinase [Chthonomonadaceae bacterium]|nr:HAMP domain-containing histidine kinase [Chthonomonadaceae bacterium]
MRLSHRHKLTLTVGILFGTILAAIFGAVAIYYDRLDAQAADDQLETVLNAVTRAVPRALENSIEEVSESPNEISVTIFKDGQPYLHTGPLNLMLMEGRGTVNVGQVAVRYMSRTVANYQIVVGMNWDAWSSSHRRLIILFALIWIPLTAFVAWTVWLTTARTFRPLLSMADEARGLSSAGPNSRLAVPHDPEFGALADHLNHFLDKIQEGVTRQEKFLADAAHELRTPLTIIRGQVETSLLRDRSVPEYQTVLRSTLEESVRMSSLVNLLLVSSRSEITPAPVVDITVAVQECVDRWSSQFAEAQVKLASKIEPAKAPVLQGELALVLDNLLGNALRFSPPGSICEVRLEAAEGSTIVTVADQGVGVPDDIKGMIFDRFFHRGSAHGPDSRGFGIGLAICKRICDARGASIQVVDTIPTGATFLVRWSMVTELDYEVVDL